LCRGSDFGKGLLKDINPIDKNNIRGARFKVIGILKKAPLLVTNKI
jgi:putative ABC transport system permease protein